MTDRKVEDLKILFSQQQIEKRTRELADEINNTFGTKEDLTIICVLKGSSMFFCDLSKYLKMPVKMEFIRVSSYGNEKNILRPCTGNGFDLAKPRRQKRPDCGRHY